MMSLQAFAITALLSLAAWTQASGQDVLTAQQYADRLQTYQDRFSELSTAPQRAPELRDSIPDSLTVESAHGQITVETKFLREGLNRFLTTDPKAREKVLSGLSDRLRALRVEAGSYEQPDRADDATRKKLDEILSSREFNRVRGPSALELLKQRIGAWILKQLRKVSPKVPDLQNAGQIFVWTMIGLAATVAGIWLYRLSRENMVGGRREILPFLPSSQTWQEWLSHARSQAAEGRWREAIHLGFWAAVSRLESDGVWAPDKARTPREYLKSIPGSNLSREPFSALTRIFEASWYGARPTTEADFVLFTANLERIGCL